MWGLTPLNAHMFGPMCVETKRTRRPCGGCVLLFLGRASDRQNLLLGSIELFEKVSGPADSGTQGK